jgi:hypothetical protein
VRLRAVEAHAGQVAAVLGAMRPAAAVATRGVLMRIVEDLGGWRHQLQDRAAQIVAGQAAGKALPRCPTVHDGVPDPVVVESAVRAVTRWMDQGWFDWDVTAHDLANIEALLVSLSGADLGAVIRRLDPGIVTRWLGEMTSRVNGFSRAHRQQLLARLVAGLDGAALTVLASSALAASSTRLAVDLGDAVAASAPDEAIEALVLTRELLEGPGLDGPMLVARSLQGVDDRDRFASIVGELVAEPTRFVAIVSWGAIANGSDGAVAPPPLDGLVAALGEIGDADLRAEVVVRLVDVLAEPRQDDFKAHVDEAIARLLEAETAATLAALSTRRDVAGEATITWVRRLFDAPDGPALLRRVTIAAAGSEVPSDPSTYAAWFAAPGGEPGYRFPNARNLGYLAGVLTVAARAEGAEAGRVIDHLLLVPGAMEGLLAATRTVVKLASWLFPSGMDAAIDGLGRGGYERVDDAVAGLEATILEHFEPDPAADPDLGSALLAFDDRMDAVVDRWRRQP